MTATRALRVLAPTLILIAVMHLSTGLHLDLERFGNTSAAQDMLQRVEGALPCLMGAGMGVIMLLAHAGSAEIRWSAWGVVSGSLAAAFLAASPASRRLLEVSGAATGSSTDLTPLEVGSMAGAVSLIVLAALALRVAAIGNLAFASPTPRRVTGRRALHGEAGWMAISEARKLFDEEGGIVIGEGYRVDRDRPPGQKFRADDEASWGKGGKAPLLCFDGGFGSSHGIVFAGSGGFKTTSVTIPTALRWGGSLILLDPSAEVAPMVVAHRKDAGRRVVILDPRRPETGFNALDWIGRFGNTKEEDIASVASWIMSDSARISGVRDDFFRASALQLLTAMIADVCLSGHTEEEDQTLSTVRANLSEPEPQLRKRLQEIYDNSSSDFVRQNVAAFVNMTPETFSGVYANAIKETHWLSYANYAALVSGSSFSADEIARGRMDVIVNIDLKTLETHAGLARLVIGSFLNAIYNRRGAVAGRVLFLLDEAARLGPMRVLETARDAGRKYGITLLMIYQSIGQLRETYGGRDASSKWFESASWISFAAINDPETADYISRRCGMTTVEADQVSRSVQARGSARTRSRQLAARPLILPHEVLLMRPDEQIVFTAGHPPLRCGRAIWFRRQDMKDCIRPLHEAN